MLAISENTYYNKELVKLNFTSGGIMKYFGKNLKELRKRAGYSQTKLAEKLNVSRLTLISYENYGQIPQRDKIKNNLLKILKCTEVELYGYSDGYYKTTKNKNLTEHVKYEVINSELKQKRCVDKHIAKKYPNGKFVQLADKSMDKLIPQHSYCYITLNEENNGFENKICAIKKSATEYAIRRVKTENNNHFVRLMPESYSQSFKVEVVNLAGNNPCEILGEVV